MCLEIGDLPRLLFQNLENKSINYGYIQTINTLLNLFNKIIINFWRNRFGFEKLLNIFRAQLLAQLLKSAVFLLCLSSSCQAIFEVG